MRNNFKITRQITESLKDFDETEGDSIFIISCFRNEKDEVGLGTIEIVGDRNEIAMALAQAANVHPEVMEMILEFTIYLRDLGRAENN